MRWIGGSALLCLLSVLAMATAPDVRAAGPAIEPGELASTTGTIEVRSSQGAHVSIDGVSHGEVPILVGVPAGEHRIEVTAPGHQPWRAILEVQARAKVSVTTDLVALEPVAPPPMVPEPPAAPTGFFPIKKKPGLLTARKPTPGSSALLSPRTQGADSSTLLRPHEPTVDQGEPQVFLATPRRRVLLPPKPSQRSGHGEVFLPKPRSSNGEVFMPVPPAAPARRLDPAAAAAE